MSQPERPEPASFMVDDRLYLSDAAARMFAQPNEILAGLDRADPAGDRTVLRISDGAGNVRDSYVDLRLGAVNYVPVITYRGIPVRVVDELLERSFAARERVILADVAARMSERLVRTIFFGTGPAAEAETKAEKLLREWLSPEQLRQYDLYGFFLVRGGRTGRQYRIRQLLTYNVDEIGPRGVAASLCFQAADAYALGDHMLAQKIALECREEEALAVAYRSPDIFGVCDCAHCEADRETLRALVARSTGAIDSSAWTGR